MPDLDKSPKDPAPDDLHNSDAGSASASIGMLISQWSLLVGVAGGLLYFLGASTVALRIFPKYGLAPTAVLSALPQTYLLQNGIYTVAPAIALTLFCPKRLIHRYATGGPVVLAGVVVGSALIAFLDPLYTVARNRHSVVPVWWMWFVRFAVIFLGLALGQRLLRRASRTPALTAGLRRGVVVVLCSMSFAVLIASMIAVFPLPTSQVCFKNGTSYQYSFLVESSDTVYLVGQHYRGTYRHPLRDSAFVWIIPRDNLQSTLVSASRRYLSCTPQRFR